MPKTRSEILLLTALVLAGALPATEPQSGKALPAEGIDPATGHRVIRLSPDGGGSSFYFHQNAYTAAGDKLVISTRAGLVTVDLKSRKVEPLVEGRAGNVVVGKKTRQAFYSRGNTIYATNLDTRDTRTVVKLPPELRGGSGLAVNADETLLAGSAGDPSAKEQVKDETRIKIPDEFKADPQLPGKKGFVAGGRSMVLYTVTIKTGQVKKFHPATDWLNHVQFSPTDPNLIMFCHEGPWHDVDRIWTIRTDGSGLRKIHTRTMKMEIAGHEFFSPDGKTIWYDLQTPKSREFWLAGFNLDTGRKTRYRVAREHWSVHFNQSPDGKQFAGDGGGPNSVARPGNGQWIYLFTPEVDAKAAPPGKDGWVEGILKAEKLVDLSKHNYKTEPNVTFTPDGNWIVFRGNMHGTTHVYAVEVNKTNSNRTGKDNS
jgi:oligogalacturonide lyase